MAPPSFSFFFHLFSCAFIFPHPAKGEFFFCFLFSAQGPCFFSPALFIFPHPAKGEVFCFSAQGAKN
jgi:hypothetical protein